jgi:hypothetical protein
MQRCCSMKIQNNFSVTLKKIISYYSKMDKNKMSKLKFF